MRRILVLSLVSLIGIAMSYFMLEITSFAGLHALNFIRPNLFIHGSVDSHFDSITEEFRREFVDGGYYDPTLGWDNVPLTEYHAQNTVGQEYSVSHDADGARMDNLPTKPVLINTYGDSMTLCDEVDDDETWQYFLEAAIGYEVKNFGVGAYGTDQAVLKFEKHLAQGVSAPITILGILDENINRVVTAFRPFYEEHSGVKLGFKPSFHADANGRIEMIPNPYPARDSSLQELRALAHRIAGEDYWLRTSGKIDIHFPYTFQAVRATAAIANRKYRDWTDAPEYIDEVNLWPTAEGSAVMHYFVDKFVKLATEAYSVPIVLFLPRAEALRRDEKRYERFADEIKKRHANLYVIDLMDHEFDRARFNVRRYEGAHATAYGNEVIARVIEQTYDRIRAEHELAPASSRSGQQ